MKHLLGREVMICLFGLVGGIALACGDGGEDGDGGETACVPGMQVACPCPDGSMSVQTCEIGGGFFEPCMCGATSIGTGETGTMSDSDSAEDSTGPDTCGNGVEDPGECGEAGTCISDCEGVDSSSGAGDSSTGEEDTCANIPTLVAYVPAIPSRWESGALVGFAAGGAMCQMAATVANVPNPGEVVVCDYEVLEAEAKGELASLPANSTAWIHRTTQAMVNGVASAPGSGGRCVDWTYQTNHISDGEFVTIGAGGVATYSLDGDTFYDGVDTTHTQPGLLECGQQMRSILCCNPPCDPQG
jgi:hypothetical protein